MINQRIAVGGTFDHLHAGHHELLKLTASAGKQLAIGLTTDEFAHGKKYRVSLESYVRREQALRQFCQSQGWQFEITPLRDIYGITLTDPTIAGLAVTTETYLGGQAVNQKRTELGLPVLPLTVAELVLDAHGEEIHSERIRAGTIDRTGNWYTDALQLNRPLSETQRRQLAHPLGALVTEPPATDGLSCVVGDVSLAKFQSQNWRFDIGVFDDKSGRETFHSQSVATFEATNAAGLISSDLMEKLRLALAQLTVKSPQMIKVVGEEDLATAALILLLPLSSMVYYGQPNQGLVAVPITEAIKAKVAGILSAEN